MKNKPNARFLALEILCRVEREKAFSSALLPVYEAQTAEKDRAFLHTLVLGVLRRQIYLDGIIEILTKKKIAKFDLEVLTALRLGLFQIYFLDKIPASAAVNESVNLVKIARKNSAAPLVNAVLRRALREKINPLEGIEDEFERVSIETSHPKEILQMWTKQFGANEAFEIARAGNQTPALAFRPTAKVRGQNDFFQKLTKDENIQPSKIAAGGFVAAKMSDDLREAAQNGLIYFQDESSQTVAHFVNLRENESFLDVCAAPGSKTTHVNFLQTLHRTAENSAPKIFAAGDKYQHRLRILRETANRTGAENVQICRYDAEDALPFADESFDCVLVDAPCSGTGTIRHNPEIRYFLSAAEIAELAAKQTKILTNAARVVGKGGRLIYSTCSLEKAENEDITESFLASNAEFSAVENSFNQRFFPHRHDTDGFFISVFRRS